MTVERIAQRFLMPRPPSYAVDWQDLDSRFSWIAAMREVAQDAQWHAEGDVWTHTRMVCEELAGLGAWRELAPAQQLACWLAALLHDVAKPYSSQVEDGRIRSRHHSPRGAVHARGLLWAESAPVFLREQVSGIVRHHQLPVYALSGAKSEARMSAASLRCNMRLLALVAEADIRGRVSEDTAAQLDNIELFAEYCRELDCWNGPRQFPSPHTRVLFFNDGRSADVEAFDDTSFTATLLSGLPGAGKTHWRDRERPGVPVVSMDEIREQRGVEPTDRQRGVRQEAKEQARAYLRKQADFIWDATNLSASRRRNLIQLFRGYGARIEIVVIETKHETLWQQNRQRPNVVPEKVIRNMLRQWEMPDETESHSVTIVTPT